MEALVSFSFRENQYSASYTICEREHPTYIYVSLKNADLVQEFGEELVLHSNGRTLLDDHVYTENRLELYTAVFKAISGKEVLKENPAATW
jgi:hypothetical protein